MLDTAVDVKGEWISADYFSSMVLKVCQEQGWSCDSRINVGHQWNQQTQSFDKLRMGLEIRAHYPSVSPRMYVNIHLYPWQITESKDLPFLVGPDLELIHLMSHDDPTRTQQFDQLHQALWVAFENEVKSLHMATRIPKTMQNTQNEPMTMQVQSLDTSQAKTKQRSARVIAILLTILGALIALVTNVASGTLPKEWEPYLLLSWPLLAVLVMLVVFLVRLQ